jgi:hypothetical protein
VPVRCIPPSQLVHQLLAAHLVVLQLIQPVQDILNPTPHSRLVHLDLPLHQTFLSNRNPCLRREIKILLAALRLGENLVEGFARRRIRQRIVALDVVTWEFRRDQRRVFRSGPGGERFGTDFYRVPDSNAVPCVLEFVVGVFADLFRAVGVLVVEGSLSA